MSIEDFENENNDNDNDDIILHNITTEKNQEITQQRIEQKKILIEKEIQEITIKREKIQRLLKNNNGAKLLNSVWEEFNLIENTEQGRIYSLSDDNLKLLIDFHTEIGDKILDPFAGHLNSAVTILQMDRKFEGYEVNKVYFEKLNEKLFQLKQRRDNMSIPTQTYEIFNENAINMKDDKDIDMILTTLPELIFIPKDSKGNKDKLYNQYIDEVSSILLKSINRLKDNGVLIIHFKDLIKSFYYRPIFLDLTNILKQKMLLKYFIILTDKIPQAQTVKDKGDIFKLYSEQMFACTHQYIMCFNVGDKL